ncbi:MAG: DUF1934 domain-containing protein [Streptococcaceae bacterium]|jgi:uncharacterized beta-barrel protein YwiB (DUF1934 family)|nr:DUF1934 domain-containing protein [Streptococcaceae bacterium]
MVKITLDNLITMAHETEKIHEVYSGDYYEKNGSHFLVYHNDLAEKVVLKYDAEMLTMTRFSNPTTVMKLHPKVTTQTAIATPIGPQKFELKTQRHQQVPTGFKTHYQFWQGDSKIADYALSVHFTPESNQT